jgi:excisionase family DNA binding protein
MLKNNHNNIGRGDRMIELMNFKETMKYLRTSRATLYRWATEGKIPAIKMGGLWRFKRDHIDKWLDSQERFKKK